MMNHSQNELQCVIRNYFGIRPPPRPKKLAKTNLSSCVDMEYICIFQVEQGVSSRRGEQGLEYVETLFGRGAKCAARVRLHDRAIGAGRDFCLVSADLFARTQLCPRY